MRLLVAALIGSVLASVAVAEPVPSPDALEKELVACLMDKTKVGTCAETLLGNRVLPGNEKLLDVASQLDDMFAQWLDKDTVFQVHPISTDKRGDIYEKRTYLVEDSSGALMMLNFTLLKTLGTWYVWKFQISSTKETIESLLVGASQ